MSWSYLDGFAWPDAAIEVLTDNYGKVTLPEMTKLLQPHFPKFRSVTRNMIYGKANRLGLKHPRARGGRTCQPKA